MLGFTIWTCFVFAAGGCLGAFIMYVLPDLKKAVDTEVAEAKEAIKKSMEQ